MTERLPLVIIDGQVQELPSGDSIPGTSSSVSFPDMTGNAGKHLAVNATEDAVEWVAQSGNSGVSHTTRSSSFSINNTMLDGNVVITASSASAIIVTVPSGLTGTEPVTVIGAGAGTVTFAVSGTTILSADGALDLRTQYSSAMLMPTEVADTYYLVGDLV